MKYLDDKTLAKAGQDLASQNRGRRGKKHTLASFNFTDVAGAAGITLWNLYKKLKKLNIHPSRIRLMSLIDLINLIDILKKDLTNNKETRTIL